MYKLRDRIMDTGYKRKVRGSEEARINNDNALYQQAPGHRLNVLLEPKQILSCEKDT